MFPRQAEGSGAPLSCLTRHCFHSRRIGELTVLQDEITVWSNDINNLQRGVDWQIKIEDAHCKLKSVYPENLL